MSGKQGRDEAKVSSLRELSPAIEPPRDLWPQIEARLAAERSATPGRAAPRSARSWAVPPRWLGAAAMVASVAVGVWIGRSLLPTGGPAPDGTVPASAALSTLPGAATALDASYVSDPRYQRDRAALVRSLEAQLAALPPPARAKVLASLAAIRHAKEDLEGELGKDPSNALLQELLVDTYQDEMRALTDLHQAGDAGKGI
jgi:hypothetical protein